MNTIGDWLKTKRCRCCRRPLRSNNRSGYCKRAVCVRHRLANDPDYRKLRYDRNYEWEKKKCATNPAWEEERRRKKMEHTRKKRAEARLALETSQA